MPTRQDKSVLKTGLIYVLVSLGILVALFGLGIDYLLPGTSPGLNLPQILIIAFGLALAAGSWRFRHGFSGRRSKTVAIALMISLATLLVLEIVLSVVGIATYFHSEFPVSDTHAVLPRNCDELGCHLDYETTLAHCAAGLAVGRRCIVNRQGYADRDEFVASDELAGRTRVMIMGDSFAQGFTADVGKSFVETIESSLPEIVLWNTGIFGTSTSQDLAAFKEFAPRLQPQLSILAFMTNDFSGNLTPLDGWLQIREKSGLINRFRRFQYNRWGIPVELRDELAYFFAIRGRTPPVGNLERILGQTRLGTLLLRLQDSLTRLTLDKSIEHRVNLTRPHLTELRDAARSLGTRLLAVVIPEREDFAAQSEEYRAAVELFEEIGIPYLEIMNQLDPIADYMPKPDGHWNNSGHQKIGAVLAECVEVFIATGDLKGCDNVVLPTPSNAN